MTQKLKWNKKQYLALKAFGSVKRAWFGRSQKEIFNLCKFHAGTSNIKT